MEEISDCIIAGMIEPLLVVDPSGTIVTANPAVLRLLGYEESELIGSPVGLVMGGWWASGSANLRLDELLKGSSFENCDVTYRSKAGKEIAVALSSSILRRDERDVRSVNGTRDKWQEGQCAAGDPGVVIISRNISSATLVTKLERSYGELQDAQAQLIHSDRMASIGQFAAGIAHEIRNPLTGITMDTAFLMEELKDNDRAIKRLKRMEKETDRVSNIVKTLLAFARPDKDRMSQVDIHDVIEETLTLREYQISLADIEIVRQFDSGLPRININPGQISQVFMNLLSNAVDSMPEGGGLFIRTYTEEGNSAELDGEVLCIEFKDSGRGISREGLNMLFRPFYTTKAPGKGVGLGLFISRGIVEDHGGQIAVRSQMRSGSAFTVKLLIGGGNA